MILIQAHPLQWRKVKRKRRNILQTKVFDIQTYKIKRNTGPVEGTGQSNAEVHQQGQQEL